jgi:hypothetical protein
MCLIYCFEVNGAKQRGDYKRISCKRRPGKSYIFLNGVIGYDIIMMCLELPLPNAALTVGREWQPVATLTSAKTMFIRGVTADVKYLKPWDGLVPCNAETCNRRSHSQKLSQKWFSIIS